MRLFLSVLMLAALSLAIGPDAHAAARVDRAECVIANTVNAAQAPLYIVVLAADPYNSLTFANGITFEETSGYVGTASNYATWSVYDCAAGQTVYDGTCTTVGSWSGQSQTVAASTAVVLYAGSYTLAAGNTLQAKRWTTWVSGAFAVPESVFTAS